MAQERREAIAADVWTEVNPLAAVGAITGVRVHNVGQGDAIALLGPTGETVVRIDYGGRGKSIINNGRLAHRRRQIDQLMPVAQNQSIFLTHWDEDHWCSARPGARAETDAVWITPRQFTSPRAVDASRRIKTIFCVPEPWSHTERVFKARNGDRFVFQKLAGFDSAAEDEDCNATGLAFAVFSAERREVIFLPGDAPFDAVPFYGALDPGAWSMRGLCAYHHGSWTHWRKTTDDFLKRWRRDDIRQRVVFSYADGNTYDHPHREKYSACLPHADLLDTVGVPARDIHFGGELRSGSQCRS